MVKYSLLFVIVLISLAYAMSAPASAEDTVEIDRDVEDVQPQETKKTKRGIYGGLGYGYGYGGHYPYYSYSFAPYYKSYGYGHGYGHYPYYNLGYNGYGHGYYW